jgi:hypothetical protein
MRCIYVACVAMMRRVLARVAFDTRIARLGFRWCFVLTRTTEERQHDQKAQCNRYGFDHRMMALFPLTDRDPAIATLQANDTRCIILHGNSTRSIGSITEVVQ